jgi:hypothetical protein
MGCLEKAAKTVLEALRRIETVHNPFAATQGAVRALELKRRREMQQRRVEVGAKTALR